jgi:hypothetical protein
LNPDSIVRSKSPKIYAHTSMDVPRQHTLKTQWIEPHGNPPAAQSDAFLRRNLISAKGLSGDRAQI